MEILIGKSSGFCNGVKFSVNKTKEVLKNNQSVYCLGKLVHNDYVIDLLTKLGLIIVNNLSSVPNESKVIFRAHGETVENYNLAKAKNLEVLDLTCGKVRLIHNKIIKNNNAFILIIGKKNHPEVIGHQSYAKNFYVIEEFIDVARSLEEVVKTRIQKVYVIVQTTFNEDKFNILIEEIQKVYKNYDLEVDKTICQTTSLRQKETACIAQKASKMIIVGSRNSSNTAELYNIAKQYQDEVYLIENKNDLIDISFNSNDLVGLMAGASTSDSIVLEIFNYLRHLFD